MYYCTSLLAPFVNAGVLYGNPERLKTVLVCEILILCRARAHDASIFHNRWNL